MFYANNMTSIQKEFFFSITVPKKALLYEGNGFLSPTSQWLHARKQEGTFVNGVFVLNIASMGKVLLNVGDVIECCG